MKSESFPPIARPDARVLILGSLPGAMSLARQQYYAQPYNVFWRIMGELVGAGPDLPYDDRLRRLKERRIAVWDTCKAAERAGSLDSAIVLSSVEPHGFAAFLSRHKAIAAIFHNGQTSASLYDRLVLPSLSPAQRALPRTRLPSTSPAHAGMPFAKKLALWREALAPFIEVD
jgi:TDG/mug DNA glycosylase family protein